MIKIGNKYYVCSEDIRKAALDSAHQMGVGGWTRDLLSKMLRDYAIMMDEICCSNMIPWTSLDDWKKDAKYLESEECFNALMKGIEKALSDLNQSNKEDDIINENEKRQKTNDKKKVS